MMSMSQLDSEPETELERAVLDNIAPRLEADGYRVVIQPKGDVLPRFFKGYRPDMIAFKVNKNIAFEIKARVSPIEENERHIGELFSGHPDWELRFIYAPPVSSDANIPVASKQIVSEHLDRLEASLDAIGFTGALLTGWAVFEAAARTLLPLNFGRPQPPVRLIEALASEGYVTPDEADTLRRLSRTRNEVAHGRLDLEATREDLARLIAVTRSILEPGT